MIHILLECFLVINYFYDDCLVEFFKVQSDFSVQNNFLVDNHFKTKYVSVRSEALPVRDVVNVRYNIALPPIDYHSHSNRNIYLSYAPAKEIPSLRNSLCFFFT